MMTTTEYQAAADTLQQQLPNSAFRPTALGNLTASELQVLHKHRKLLRKTALQLAVTNPDSADSGRRAIEIVLGLVGLDRAVILVVEGGLNTTEPAGAKVLPGEQSSERFPGRRNFLTDNQEALHAAQ